MKKLSPKTKKDVPLIIILGSIGLFCFCLAVSQGFASTGIDWSDNTVKAQESFDIAQSELAVVNIKTEQARIAYTDLLNEQKSKQQTVCASQIPLAQYKYTDVSVSPLTEEEKLDWYTRLATSAEGARQCLGF